MAPRLFRHLRNFRGDGRPPGTIAAPEVAAPQVEASISDQPATASRDDEQRNVDIDMDWDEMIPFLSRIPRIHKNIVNNAVALREFLDMGQVDKGHSPLRHNRMPDTFSFAQNTYTNSSWPSNLEWQSHSTEESSKLQMDMVRLAADACLRLQTDPNAGTQVHLELQPINAGGDQRGGVPHAYGVDMRFEIHDAGEGDSRIIVVVVESRRTWANWLVTYAYERVNAEGFTGIEGLSTHDGLLQVAMGLISHITVALRDHLAVHVAGAGVAKPRLLLCGYSTGGAVSSLMWRHLIAMRHCVYDGTWQRPPGPDAPRESIVVHFDSIHCRTFGAPPYGSYYMLPLAPPPGQTMDTEIAFVNEGDPAPRMDFTYLVNLLWLAAVIPRLRRLDRFTTPVLGWLHAPPDRQLFNPAALLGFRVLQENAGGGTDDVCAVLVNAAVMDAALPLDFAQHSMSRYDRNVRAWQLRDADTLAAETKIRLAIGREMMGGSVDVNPDAELRIVGLEPWFESGDLGSFREWRASALNPPNGWVLERFGFDYPWDFQIAQIIHSVHQAEDNSTYVRQYRARGASCGGSRSSCALCPMFRSRKTRLALLSGDKVAIGNIEEMGKRERSGCSLSSFLAKLWRSKHIHPEALLFVQVGKQSVGGHSIFSNLTFEVEERPTDALRLDFLNVRRKFEIDMGLYAYSSINQSKIPNIQSPPQADIDRESNFDVIRGWLDTCKTSESHSRCRIIAPDNPRLPTRVIDVSPGTRPGFVRLHETGGQHGRYLTLSYVWGANPQTKTTLETLDEFKDSTRGIDIATLPKTIQDAIHVTRKLGVNYLWVDSLCIIQNSEADLARELIQMAHIYKHAELTISAAAASTCHEGFLHTRRAISRRLATAFPIDFPVLEEPSKHAASHKRQSRLLSVVRRGLEPPQTYRTVYVCPDASIGYEIKAFKDEFIETRAWTMQESWLSRRLLIFGAGVPRWVCLAAREVVGGWKDRDSFYFPRMAGRERVLATNAEDAQFPGLANELIDRFRCLQANDEEAARTLRVLSDVADSLPRSPEAVAAESIRDKLEQWQGLASTYSSRGLSFPADKLRAISALASEFDRWLVSDYLAGLWRCNLLRELLWHQWQDGRRPTCQRPAQYRAPSWSWAAVDGDVQFDEFHDAYPTTTRAVLHECGTELVPTKPTNPYGQVTGGFVMLTAPLRRLSRRLLFERFVIAAFGTGPYFGDYIVPDAALDNEDFANIPEGNRRMHGSVSGRPHYYRDDRTPSYEQYREGEARPMPDYGATTFGPIPVPATPSVSSRALPGVASSQQQQPQQQETSSSAVPSADDDLWFLELARSDGPRGLVLIRTDEDKFRRTGYFRLGRTSRGVGLAALDDMNVAGPRDWQWTEGLEMTTVRIE